MKKDIVFSTEQLKAVNFPLNGERSAIVSAAAGSGKTAVLIERVIRLITDSVNPIDTDKIVLVTFTKKAAAEMRQRLETALKSLPDTPAIRKQLIRLEEAKISTVHSFCLSLLQENAGPAGLEQGFKIAEESQLALLEKQAMKETLEEFYNGGFSSEQVIRTTAFFGSDGDASLRRGITDLYKFTRNLPNWEAWLDRQVYLYENPDVYYNEVVPPYWDAVKQNIEKAISLTVESIEAATHEKTIAFLNGDLTFFENAYNDINHIDGAKPADLNVRNEKDDYVKELIKNNRAITKSIRESVVAATNLINTFKEAINALCPIIKVFVRVFRIYCEKLAEIKSAERVIDFSDAEHLCLKMLQNNKSVLTRIQDEYKLIIVDEFQDSNFLQYELFRLLNNNDGDNQGKLFLVGDLKQSIYRFRSADPAVFNAVTSSPDFETIHLSQNFRSSDETIDCVNAIFEHTMPDYDENARLQPGRGISDTGYKAEFIMLDDSAGKFVSTEAEAEYAAEKIKVMVEKEYKVFGRPCDYGDFAVISSVKANVFAVYEKVFRKHGIPYISEGSTGYLKTEEIGLALDLLKVINNPYDDLALFNIMLSPLFNFTADEIALYRADKRDMPLYSSILSNKAKKAKAFIKTISHYRRLADISSVSELISLINGEGGFLPLTVNGSDNLTFKTANANKTANIRLLSHYAREFSAIRADSGLSAFLAYINELQSVNVDVKQAKGNSKAVNSVQLLSIHGAKGLEFPICFVAKANKDYTKSGGNAKNQAKQTVKFDKTAGIVAHYFDEPSLCRIKTLHYDYADCLEQRLKREEEMRKLYVAATRAECKLFFTGYAKDGKICENSYANWLQDTVPQTTHPTNDENKETEVKNPTLQKTQKIDNIDITEIRKNFSAVYPRQILTTVPKKLTATQIGVEFTAIQKHEQDEPSVFPRNPSFHKQKRLTGKKRGDVYHKVMEIIDFNAGDYEKQLAEMKPRFTEIEYKAIDRNAIIGFFGSPLGNRAVKSGNAVKEYKLYTEIELSELGITDDLTALSDTGEASRPFIQGIADMFFYEDGEIVLVDYKTNRGTTAEKLTADYHGQLRIYKKAIEEMTGVRVKECWLYSFDIGGILV